MKVNKGVIIGCLVAACMVGLICTLISFSVIKEGQVGLPTKWGRFTGETWHPGPHWKALFGGGVVKITTQELVYETSDNPDTSDADYTDFAVSAQTIDGQQVSIKYTVKFQIDHDDAIWLVRNLGRERHVVEKVVKAYSRNASRLLAQNYTAEELYSGAGIASYQETVKDSLSESFGEMHVSLTAFLVRKIKFNEDYVDAIENQQIAQEAIETAQYEAEAAEYRKQQTIREAEADKQRAILMGEADAARTVLQANADAEKQRTLADAEAYGIEVRGKMLQRYPEVLNLEFVNSLEGVTWGILPGDGITMLLPAPEQE